MDSIVGKLNSEYLIKFKDTKHIIAIPLKELKLKLDLGIVTNIEYMYIEVLRDSVIKDRLLPYFTLYGENGNRLLEATSVEDIFSKMYEFGADTEISDWVTVTDIPLNELIYKKEDKETIKQEETENEEETENKEVETEEENKEVETESMTEKAITKQVDIATFETEYKTINTKEIVEKLERLDKLDKLDNLSKLSDLSKMNDNFELLVTIIDEAISERKSETVEEQEYAEEPKDFLREDFCNNVHYTNNQLDPDELIGVSNIQNSVLFISAPGFAKTTLVQNLAYYKLKKKDDSRVLLLSLNGQSSYNDIIGGCKPDENSNKDKWIVRKGLVTMFCEKAAKDPDKDYILILDELTRGDVTQVLGELMTAISKRGCAVTTNAGFKLTVPKNLTVFATANIFDSSTIDLDIALLDRFSIVDMPEIIVDVERLDKTEEVTAKLKLVQNYVHEINRLIQEEPGGKYMMIGNRYLYLNYDTVEELKRTVKYNLLPHIHKRVDCITTLNTKNNILKLVSKIEETFNN